MDTGSAKINVDWPADAAADAAPAYGRFGVSDHDPAVARFDATAGFDGVRALVDHLAATDQLPAGLALALRLALDTSESLAAAGKVRPAGKLLAAAAVLVRLLGAVGVISGDVAAGLAGEFDLLRGSMEG